MWNTKWFFSYTSEVELKWLFNQRPCVIEQTIDLFHQSEICLREILKQKCLRTQSTATLLLLTEHVTPQNSVTTALPLFTVLGLERRECCNSPCRHSSKVQNLPPPPPCQHDKHFQGWCEGSVSMPVQAARAFSREVRLSLFRPLPTEDDICMGAPWLCCGGFLWVFEFKILTWHLWNHHGKKAGSTSLFMNFVAFRSWKRKIVPM